MKNNKVIKVLLLIISLALITTGCGKKANLKNGNSTAVSVKEGKISATDYYNEIKETNISKLVDMIDHKLFDEKYKTDDDENKEVKSQIEQIKSSYSNDETTYLSVIKQYFGVNSEDELEDMLRLEYKRNEAVKDYVKESLTDSEIKKYYNENIIGDIKASHILISVDASDDATSEEKEKAEEKAKKEAEKIIKKLNQGKKFSDLAKKYSDDEATKENGGDLGYFNNDDMDENFMAAVKELKNNEYTSEPVKTQYGYHIILKVDQKEKKSLKSVKSEIKENLTEEKLSNDSALHYNALIEIREKNNIKWNDDELKKAYEDLMDQLIKNTSQSSQTN